MRGERDHDLDRHLFSGRRPVPPARRKRPLSDDRIASSEAIARAVCDQEPERPGVSRDLDNIVLKALRKEPERRYDSVGALAEDLKRYLEGRPVMARKDTLGYRAARFIGRHKAGTAAAAIGALALAGAMGAALYQARVARAERAAAEARFSDVRQLTDSFLFEFHDAIRDLPGSTPARELVVKRALQYLEKLSSIKGGDAGLQRELATAYERVASVQGGMYETHVGDTGGARQSLARALAIRRELAASTLATRDDREALAQAELQLAQVEIVAGEGEAAEARSRRAVSMYAALVAEEPSSRLMRARLARARRYLATSMRRTRRDEAVAMLKESAAAFEALAAEDPATPGYTREVSITHQQLLEALAGHAGARRGRGELPEIRDHPGGSRRERARERVLPPRARLHARQHGARSWTGTASRARRWRPTGAPCRCSSPSWRPIRATRTPGCSSPRPTTASVTPARSRRIPTGR